MTNWVGRIWEHRVTIVISLLFLTYLLPKPYEIEKYILLSLVPFGLIITKPKFDLSLSKPTLVWLSLMIYMGVSLIWAEDIGRSLQDFFMWVSFSGLLLYASIYKNSLNEDRTIWHLVIVVLFFSLLMLHFVALHFDLAFTRAWHDLLAKNKNYTVSLITILFPYLLFYNSNNQFIRFTKVASAFLIFNIVIILGVRGALLSLVILIVFKIYTLFDKRVLIYASLAGVLMFMSYHYIPNLRSNLAASALVTDYQEQQESRSYLNKTSLDILNRNILIGAGIGQWWVHAYKRSVEEVEGLDEPLTMYRLAPHNLYTKLLSELGILGFSLVLMIFLWPFKIYLSAHIDDRREMNKYLGVWIVYLVLIVFYASAQSTPFYFSGIMFVAIFSLGRIYSQKESISRLDAKVFVSIYAVALLICISWFMNQYSKYKNIKKAEYLLEIGDNSEAINLLEKSYHPYSFSSYENNEVVLFNLAQSLEQSDKIEEANKVYVLSLKKNPNNTNIQYQYASFLVKNSIDQNSAIELLNEVIRVQPKFDPARELLESIGTEY